MRIRRQLTPRVIRDRVSVPRPELELHVRIKTERGHAWEPLTFVIDTGADVTSIPIPVATELGIEFDRSDDPSRMSTQHGGFPGHPGRIKVMVDGHTFDWLCYFTEVAADTNAPSDDPFDRVTSPPPVSSRRVPVTVEAWSEVALNNAERHSYTCLLGRAEVLTRDFDFQLDGTHYSLVRRGSEGLIARLWHVLWGGLIRFLRREG